MIIKSIMTDEDRKALEYMGGRGRGRGDYR